MVKAVVGYFNDYVCYDVKRIRMHIRQMSHNESTEVVSVYRFVMGWVRFVCIAQVSLCPSLPSSKDRHVAGGGRAIADQAVALLRRPQGHHFMKTREYRSVNCHCLFCLV